MSPNVWRKPLVTSQALYHSIESSGRSLIIWTHLQPITFYLRGKETRVQVLFLLKATILACMVATYSDDCKACVIEVGSIACETMLVRTLSEKTLHFACATITWVLESLSFLWMWHPRKAKERTLKNFLNISNIMWSLCCKGRWKRYCRSWWKERKRRWWR